MYKIRSVKKKCSENELPIFEQRINMDFLCHQAREKTKL